MTVAMVGFTEQDYPALCGAMEKLISDSQCFLFNILASAGSIGEKWARQFGAPLIYPSGQGLEVLMKEADYFMINNDGSPQMHRLIFKIMQSGKHGTIMGQEYK